MGEAIIKGLSGHTIYVCESNIKRLKYLRSKYRVNPSSIKEALAVSSIVILAVKPQDMKDVLMQISASYSSMGNRIFISIAAGLTTKFFERHLIGKAKIVRCMPNLPALIGEGITGLCPGRYAKLADLKTAEKVLSSIGKTLIVSEALLDPLTAVSGSGPAYVFLFVEQWMAAAKSLGFNEKQARLLVYSTLKGSAHLLDKSELDAATFRAKVTSKGGTTQAAMDVFGKGKFDQLMKKALLAARNRAKQLST